MIETEKNMTVEIGTVFQIKSGGTPSRKKEEYFAGGQVPWVKTGDLKGKYVNYPSEYISDLGLKNSSAKLFPEKSVLLAMYGATIGACSILNFPAATNQACAALLPSNDCDETYLYYFLKSKKQELIYRGVGGAQPNISATILKGVKIPLLPLPEQKRIAAILDAADALRQKDEQLIDHYNQLSQSLFLDMFGDPVANDKNWENVQLKDISTKIVSGNTPKGGSKVYVDDGIMFFRSQNVWRNRLELDDIVYLDNKTHQSMQKSSLHYKDILMTKTGRFNTENSSLGRAAMYRGKNGHANVNGHVYLIRLKENVIHEFILFILTSEQYREHIRRVCVGGIDKRQLNKSHIEEFPIICPSIELQQKFVHQFSLIEELKTKSEESLIKSNNLFNSLLQKAFTGELT